MTPSDYRAVVVTMPARQRVSDGMVLLPNSIALHPDGGDLTSMAVTPVNRPASDLDAAERDATIAALRIEIEHARAAQADANERAVAAELELAHVRASTDGELRRMRTLIADHPAALRKAGERGLAMSRAWTERGGRVDDAVSRIAAVYGRAQDWTDRSQQPDPAADYGSAATCLLAADELAEVTAEFLAELADGPHPAVTFAALGPAVLAEAHAAARFELSKRGGTLEAAVEGALNVAAQRAEST